MGSMKVKVFEEPEGQTRTGNGHTISSIVFKKGLMPQTAHSSSDMNRMATFSKSFQCEKWKPVEKERKPCNLIGCKSLKRAYIIFS